MNQKIGKNKIGRMTPRIHGHTKIVFTDKFGRETVKFDKDNLVTDAIQKIFESNYFGSIDYYQLMPAIHKTLGGVILFESTLGNDPTDIWIPTSFNNRITGHAGQTVPASLADDITRGLPNTAASASLVNGYKMVWNFPETQGNGDISAVGLCHSDFGDYALKNTDFKPLEMISNDSVKSVSWAADNERLKIINAYDSVNGYSYSLAWDQVTLNTNGQMINNNTATIVCKRRKNQLINNLAVDMSHFLGNEEAEETFTLTWDSGVLSGTFTNLAISSIYIDNTNNLLWITPSYGNSSLMGDISTPAVAYDMTQFADGVTVNPVKTSSSTGRVLGTTFPTQGIIKEGPEGYIPSIGRGLNRFNFGLVSYDEATKDFTNESLTALDLPTGNLGERFPTVMAMGNYYYIRGNRVEDFCKLIEVDTDNDTMNEYDVSPESIDKTVTPFYMDPNNPVVGAEVSTYSPIKFTMGKSGTAINKLYLATKNDLPAVITKTAANSMRVEYSLTYI